MKQGRPTQFLPFLFAIMAFFSLSNSATAQGDCMNDYMYPPASIVASTDLQEIASCNVFGDFSEITGIQAYQDYEFTVTNGGFITVREGDQYGPVIASGTSPLIATAPTAGNITVHWNANSSCGEGADCQVTTVQCVSCVDNFCINDQKDPSQPHQASMELNSISACNEAGEYSEISGIQADQEYEFTMENGGHITVRSGTFDGALVAAGPSPLVVTAPGPGNLFVHWNSDSNCGVNTDCNLTTVQCLSCNDDFCMNSLPYPTAPIQATMEVTQISGCNYAGDYSEITGIQADQEYEFTMGEGGYITVRSDAYDGGILAAGPSPLVVTAPYAGSLFVHWNVDSSCGTLEVCHATTVQCLTCDDDLCVNNDLYPTNPVEASTEITQVSSCTWPGEYSIITGIQAMQEYEFTMSEGAFITVRAFSFEGAVVASGTSPLVVTAPLAGDLYVHWNSDASCGIDFDCRTTTVQCLTCTDDDCLNETQYPGMAVEASADLTQIDDCSFGGDYTEISNIEAGQEYRFTIAEDGFITVRQGSFDGPSLGADSVQIDVVALTDENIFVHWNTDSTCGVSGECKITTVQCMSCEVLDCPDLGNIGDPCDDGDPDTENDSITADCDCVGEPVTGVGDMRVSAFSIYPNPVVDQFVIRVGGDDVGTFESATIYDIHGRMILEFELEPTAKNRLTLPHPLPAGLYTVKLMGNGHVASRKIVVEN